MANEYARRRYSSHRWYEVFWRTLIGDAKAELDDFYEYYRAWLVLLKYAVNHGPTDMSDLKHRTIDSEDAEINELYTPRIQSGVNRWILKSQLKCGMRHFCVTEKGYIGLVSPTSQPG